jgi:hypothetical protein
MVIRHGFIAICLFIEAVQVRDIFAGLSAPRHCPFVGGFSVYTVHRPVSVYPFLLRIVHSLFIAICALK